MAGQGVNVGRASQWERGRVHADADANQPSITGKGQGFFWIPKGILLSGIIY